MALKWKHYEGDSECDEFWATSADIFEFHVGKLKDGSFDCEVLIDGKEQHFKDGFQLRHTATRHALNWAAFRLRQEAEKMRKEALRWTT